MADNNKVMLVEDDATMQAVLRTLLELEGFQVALSAGKNQLAEVLQAIRDACPNVILLDVHIRELSGYEVVQHIRQDPGMCPVRVIMTSGMDVKDQCLAAGADDFIMKPFMPDELINKLQGRK